MSHKSNQVKTFIFMYSITATTRLHDSIPAMRAFASTIQCIKSTSFLYWNSNSLSNSGYTILFTEGRGQFKHTEGFRYVPYLLYQ